MRQSRGWSPLQSLTSCAECRARRRTRQRLAAGVAAIAAVAVFVLAGTGLLPDRLELWIEDVVRQPDDAPDQSTDEAFEMPGIWTVETSLGTWTWTRVPEGEGAMDLWNEADRRFRATTELPNRPKVTELVPVPDIPGMWRGPLGRTGRLPQPRPETELPDIPWARRGGVTVAVVGVYGTIDWGSMYGNPEAHPRWSDRTVEVTLGWDEQPVAQLEVSLVPGEPAPAEFHDRHTGELVLRLEATDPAVSAAQLVAQRGHPAAHLPGSPCRSARSAPR